MLGPYRRIVFDEQHLGGRGIGERGGEWRGSSGSPVWLWGSACARCCSSGGTPRDFHRLLRLVPWIGFRAGLPMPAC